MLKDSFNIDDVSYLFGYKTDTYYTEKYFYKYAKTFSNLNMVEELLLKSFIIICLQIKSY